MKVLFSLSILLGVCLYATEEDEGLKHFLIQTYDKNKDGMIFYTEAPKEIQDDFCQYDVNQDGFIDIYEVEAIE